jgi:hypothetical protein
MDGPSQACCELGLAEFDLAQLFWSRHVEVPFPLDRHLDDLAIRKRHIADHDLVFVHRCRESHRHASRVAHTRRAPQQRVRQRNRAISRAASSGLAKTRTHSSAFRRRDGREAWAEVA